MGWARGAPTPPPLEAERSGADRASAQFDHASGPSAECTSEDVARRDSDSEGDDEAHPGLEQVRDAIEKKGQDGDARGAGEQQRVRAVSAEVLADRQLQPRQGAERES